MQNKPYNRKFIESEAMPLEAINKECVREKSIRHGHPSTLHLWWARRPLAAARAVIFASLVDNPFDRPDLFATSEEMQAESDRLADILKRLAVWENSNNPNLLNEAKEAIAKYTTVKGEDGKVKSVLPQLLDPFAGGGAIPLEGARLGLTAYAQDLNPVAVLINKAMIEIPPKFAGMRPVNPKANPAADAYYAGAGGLAEDVEYYGKWMKARAAESIGAMYPKVRGEDGKERTVIAWLWTRTVRCPNPMCRCEAPLAGSFVLSKKAGREAYTEARYDEDGALYFTVHHGAGEAQQAKTGKGQFRCIKCKEAMGGDYIKGEFTAHRNGARLMAIVAEGAHGREYITPTEEQERAADVERREDAPDEGMNQNCPDIVSGRGFGFTHWSELFTPRQLAALCTFSDLVMQARAQAAADIKARSLSGAKHFIETTNAESYADAVATYLAFVVDKMAMNHNALCTWHNGGEKLQTVFARQAIPMTWDYAEGYPFSNSTGCFDNMLMWVTKSILELPTAAQGFASQHDAGEADERIANVMVSFDPPYYDNIAYADLSDFFYVWLRRSLGSVYPALFTDASTPKSSELVATPYRFEGGKKEAAKFYEEGMARVFRRIRGIENIRYPMTVYYAYRQSDTDISGTASTGWETLLSSIIQAGFTITGTLPLRTERSGRMVDIGSNALASSVVIVCRPRAEDARPMQWGQFISELQEKMASAVEKMTAAKMQPVDMAQAAIGPGMEVYSAAKAVLRVEGGTVSVRDALKEINRALDAALSRGNGNIDAESRVCYAVWEKWQWGEVRYGEVDTLSRAKNTSVQAITEAGAAAAEHGKFTLFTRTQIASQVMEAQKARKDSGANERATLLASWYAMGQKAARCVWLAVQVLTAAMADAGYDGAGYAAAGMGRGTADRAKKMCYSLYQISERKGNAAEARAYNIIISGWHSVEKARDAAISLAAQGIHKEGQGVLAGL